MIKVSRLEKASSLKHLGCFRDIDGIESKVYRSYRAMFVDNVKQDASKLSSIYSVAI